jgi:hypothetical protein
MENNKAEMMTFQKHDRARAQWERGLRAAVKKVAPYAYYTMTGWCGPDFKKAQQADAEYCAANPAPVAS